MRPLILTGALCLTLSACGIKGPLEIPRPPAAKPMPAPTPTINPAPSTP